MTAEEFAPISGYSNYLVSESGRIWSEEHFSKSRLIKGRMRAPNWRGGYLGMWMKGDDGETRYRSIHHVVAETFIGPNTDNMYVLHNDNDPSNNHWSNLRYGTQSENIQQAYDQKRRFGFAK